MYRSTFGGSSEDALTLTTLLPRVSVVLAVREDAASLVRVLERIPVGHEVVLVAHEGAGPSVAAARDRRPDVRVVARRHRDTPGALESGIAAASGDIVVTLAADGSQRPEEIGHFVTALCEGADLATGSRAITGGTSADVSPVLAAGTGVLTAAANVLFRTRATDVTYDYTAFWRTHAADLSGRGGDAEGALLLPVRAARAGLRVVEVPCRAGAPAPEVRPLRDGTRVLRALLNERLRRDRRPDGPVSTAVRPQPERALRAVGETT